MPLDLDGAHVRDQLTKFASRRLGRLRIEGLCHRAVRQTAKVWRAVLEGALPEMRERVHDATTRADVIREAEALRRLRIVRWDERCAYPRVVESRQQAVLRRTDARDERCLRWARMGRLARWMSVSKNSHRSQAWPRSRTYQRTSASPSRRRTSTNWSRPPARLVRLGYPTTLAPAPAASY